LLGTIIRFSVLLARGIMGAEKVFGTYNIGVIVFFNAMPRKKRFTDSVIGFFGILGAGMTPRNPCFLLPRSPNKELTLLGI
jgi:hypothetical protein